MNVNAVDIVVQKPAPKKKTSKAGKKPKRPKIKGPKTSKDPLKNYIQETSSEKSKQFDLQKAMKKLIKKKAKENEDPIKPSLSRRRAIGIKRRGPSGERLRSFGQVKQKSSLKKKFDDRKKLEEMLNFARYNIARLSSSDTPKSLPDTIPKTKTKTKIKKPKESKIPQIIHESTEPAIKTVLGVGAKPKKKGLKKRKPAVRKHLSSDTPIVPIMPNIPKARASAPVTSKFEQKMSTVYEVMEKEPKIKKNVKGTGKKKVNKSKTISEGTAAKVNL